MKILVWGIESDIETVNYKASHLLDTSKHFNIDVEFIGVGYTFTNFKDRLYILQEYLKNIDSDEIIIVMDGYDTLFANNINLALEIFLSKKTKILISAEKMYTYQYSTYIDKYDTIKSPYRYVNAGTYMGYCKYISVMVDEMLTLESDATIDQGLMGIWVYNNFENKDLVLLDTNCEVFWVSSSDWEYMKTIDMVYNETTKTYPIIIHNTGNSNSILYDTYKHMYNIITQK